MTRRRALLAAVLAAVYPGLGHVYLREWFRAVLWFGLSIVTAAMVIPPEVVSGYQSGGIGALIEASRNLPSDALFSLLLVRVMNVVDAAWLGLRSGTATAAEGQGPTCPNCGRGIDADLDFCHWCTTPLDGGADESKADGGLL